MIQIKNHLLNKKKMINIMKKNKNKTKIMNKNKKLMKNYWFFNITLRYRKKITH